MQSSLVIQDRGVLEMNRIRAYVEATEFPDNLADLLDDRARIMGDAVVANFFHDDFKLSYRELSNKSRQFADSLMRLGVRKGSHVAVMMGNVAPFLVIWFAIARLGAVVVPINNRYKQRELDYTLRSSDAEHLIVDDEASVIFESLAETPPLISEGSVILVGATKKSGYQSFYELVQNGAPEFVVHYPVKETDLLAIQYTSGSTGFPKGCMQSHQFWMTFAATGAALRSPDAEDTIKNILVTYPLFYLQAQIEFLFAVYNCGTAFIARRPSRSQLMDWVRKYSIHYCAMNPMVYNGLPVHDDDSENQLKFIAAYYHKGEILRNLEARFNTIGRDSFGMTEIGAGTTLPASANHMLDAGTCGLAAPFRQVRICDENGKVLVHGEVGELCFSGQGIFWGYYKRPQANKDSFHEGRWFRTGDMAYQDENGYIYIVGRIKEMIKRGGENISALEIEQVVREFPDIREVAVLSVPDSDRMEEVRVVVSLKDTIPIDEKLPKKLERHCRDRLADFKVPRYFGFIDKFPRTGSKKIDKNRLKNESNKLGCRDYDVLHSKWCNL